MGYIHAYRDYEGVIEMPAISAISAPSPVLPVSAEPVILARIATTETPIIEDIPMDTEALGVMIQSLEKRMAERFDSMEKRFDVVDKRFDAVDRRFDAVDKRFEKAEERSENIEQSVKNLSDRAIHLQWMVGIAIVIALIALGKQFWPFIETALH